MSSFTDRQQNDAILAELHAQKQNVVFCDVVMKVLAKEIYAHSAVLAAASPYFNSFLSQDLPRQFSQRSPQVIEIQIDGIESNSGYEMAVGSVIDFIYTGKLKVNHSNVSQICEIARIMQIQSVVNFCELFLSGKASSKVEAIAAPSSTESVYSGSSSVASKMRHGQLVSNSTQVTPNLLGLDYKPKPSKDVKTQTLMKDFPKEEAQIPELDVPFKKRRGRKPTIVARIDTEARAQNANIETNADKETEGERKLELSEIKDDTGVTEIEEFCNAETEFIVNIITPAETDTPAGVRRSGRTRKPTPKILGSSNKRSLTIPLGVKSLKKQEPQEQMEVCDIKSSETSVSSPSKMEKTPSKQSTVTVKYDDGGVDAGGTRSTETEQASEMAVVEPQTDGEVDACGIRSTETEQASEMAVVEPQTDVSEIEIAVTVEQEGAETKQEDVSYVSLLQDPDAVAAVDELIETVDGDMKEKILNAKQKAEELDSKMTERELRKKEKRRGRRPNPPKCRCSECGFTTNRIREMASHKKLHQLAKNSCIYCDREFKSKDELGEHMERHKGPLPYFCHICDFRFRNRTQLNTHLPRHSDEKPFHCQQCPSSFKWRHSLKSHMVVHSNKKDHLCDICGYASAHKSQLRAHRLIHTGNTFKCEVQGCTFQATKRQNLKYHMLSHTREKPHVCEVCGQAFSFVKNMRRHMKLHSLDRPYTCSKCEYATTRFDKLKDHELKAHGIGTPPEKRMRISDLVLIHKIKQLQTIVEGEEAGQNSEAVLDGINHQQHELMEIQPEQLQEVQVQLPQGQSALGVSEQTVPVVQGEDGIAMFDVKEISSSVEGATPVTVVQEMSDNSSSQGGTKAVELVPGHTIIIQQTTESGEIQEIALPIGPTQPLGDNPSTSSETGQNFTEIMIPANQVAEYMQQIAGQQVTFVTQQ